MARRRADIKLGYSCNSNCVFCGEAESRHLGDKSTAEVKRELAAIPAGISEIVLTGGEPTIRRDFFEIISLASRLFGLVQVQTNARMFSYPEFAARASGLPNLQFFVSFAAPDPQTHDSLTRARGSFIQAVAGIKNLKSAGKFVILNCVITKKNLPLLPELAVFASGLGIDQLQFSFVHPAGNALANYSDVVPRISDAAAALRPALDACDSKGLKCLVEGIPPCLLQGHEGKILELYYRHARMSPGAPELRLFGRGKAEGCAKCRHGQVCFGTWKSYLDKEGVSEFLPVPGRMVFQSLDETIFLM